MLGVLHTTEDALEGSVWNAVCKLESFGHSFEPRGSSTDILIGNSFNGEVGNDALVGLDAKDGVALEFGHGQHDKDCTTTRRRIKIVELFSYFIQQKAIETLEKVDDQQTIRICIPRLEVSIAPTLPVLNVVRRETRVMIE
jgi:hypothetical protein